MRAFHTTLVLILLASPALAESGNDAWAQVPLLPTACYRENDEFEANAYAAAEALQNEKMRQDQANEAIAQQFRNMDVMEQQQRMMAFLMEHPEEAQRYMETLQQAGQDGYVQSAETAERQLQLDARLEDLIARYDVALQEAIGPTDARQQALQASSDWCSPASLVEMVELNKQKNRAYDTLCAGWWKEGGAFHSWFAEFKQFQTELGAQQDGYSAATKLNYEVMGITTDQYRPTNYLSAPIEYLRRTQPVFFKRNPAPVSEEAIDACRDGHG